MKLTDEQAHKIGRTAYENWGPNKTFANAGRAAFEESMRIALECPRVGEVRQACLDAGIPHFDNRAMEVIKVFLANRIASYYEPQDRTTQRLQKWFTTHGHPEFAHDPQPLEQLAAIVIEEYEKRKKDSTRLAGAYEIATGR